MYRYDKNIACTRTVRVRLTLRAYSYTLTHAQSRRKLKWRLCLATLVRVMRVKVDGEIASYLDFPAPDSDQQPLGWWKREHTRFPALSQLAKKYLSLAQLQKESSVGLVTWHMLFDLVYDLMCWTN